MNQEYRKRIVDQLLKKKLESMGAVLIEGPKLCGKSTTAIQQAESILNVEPGSILDLAELNPKLLLQGATPRLIDEWQLAPQLWDAIRREVDQRGGEPGQFILTGLAITVDPSQLKHSGTGRFSWLRMRPMTLYESGESNGSVSLRDLFEGQVDIGSTNTLSLEQVAFAACRGGWPTTLRLEGETALTHAFEYVEAVIKQDISRADGIKRNQDATRKLLRSYARFQGSQVSAPDLAKDINGLINEKTVLSYLNALKEIFVIEDLPAWNPNLRSKTAIRQSDTRYFVAPSIVAAALNARPKDLLFDTKTFGFIFETLCIRDLRVYAEALGGSLFHFRDKYGLECDVLHRRNGTYGLIEIKLGSNKGIEDGAKTLHSLASKIDLSQMLPPSFLMVLTASGNYAYRRGDGVLVVPIGCLKI